MKMEPSLLPFLLSSLYLPSPFLLGSPGLEKPLRVRNFSTFYLVASLFSAHWFLLIVKLQSWQNIPEGRKAGEEMPVSCLLKLVFLLITMFCSSESLIMFYLWVNWSSSWHINMQTLYIMITHMSENIFLSALVMKNSLYRIFKKLCHNLLLALFACFFLNPCIL